MSQDTPDPNTFTYPYQLTRTIHREPYADLIPDQHSQRGKIVVITGAYGGLGSATAAIWARAGASGIVLAGRKAEALAALKTRITAIATEPTARVLSVTVDVTVEAEVERLFTRIRETFGRPADVLINNAGGAFQAAPVGEVAWDDFVSVINSHFLGSTLVARLFVRACETPKDPQGTIIFVTSGLSAKIAPGLAAYSIAKLAGQRMTEYLDAEYPRLRTFTLSPGIINHGGPGVMLSPTAKDVYRPFSIDHIDMPGLMSVYLSETRADFLRGGFVGINWDIGELEAHREEIKEKQLLKLRFVGAQLGKGGHPWSADS